MTETHARDRRPSVRTIPKSIRTSPIEVLWSLAMSQRQDQEAHGANEWYWVRRFGHPLVDHINIKSFMSLQSIYAKELTKDEIGQLTTRDLDVLARSQSPLAREVAARHKSCPAGALALLAEDADSAVRRAVGHNPSTPAAVIASMQSRVQFGKTNDEVDEERVRFLWMELDSGRLDEALAMEIASDPDYRYTAEHRLALGRRKYLSVEVRTALAENRSTPPEILARLAEDPDASVRIAAGTNMSLPESSRLRLLKDRDRQVRTKLMIEGQFSDAVVLSWDNDYESRHCLARRLEAGVWVWGDKRNWDSEAVLRELSQSPHPETRAGVALNAHTPVDVLEHLAEDEEKIVRDAVGRALSFGSANDYFHGGLDLTYIWWYRRDFEESELSQLAHSASPRVRASIATRLPRGADLQNLTKDPDPFVRRSAAGHPLIDFDDLIRLSDDPDEDVRQSVAQRVHWQLRTRQEPPEKIENWLEWQETIPPAIPQKYGLMGSGPDMEHLRLGKPWDREAPWPRDDALDRLSRVGNERIRAAVAAYSGSYSARMGESSFAASFDLRLGPETLTRLLQDSSTLVRESSLKNTGPAAIAVAAGSNAPSEALVGYARSKAPAVRRAVATNPATPGPVLANLARDSDLEVRVAVAGNQATPTEALVVLSEDRDEDLVLALLSNPNTPAEFLEAQATRKTDFGEYERHRRLAGNPSSPAVVLAKIAYSKWVDVRQAVAANVHTPPETIEILSFDEDPRVRQAVKRRQS